MRMKKKHRGGFVDPEKEKWEIKTGLIVLGLLLIVFVVLLGRWLTN